MAAWLRGTKESLPSKHRRDRERKETADREHCREATHLSFSCADSMSVPPDQTFPTDENRPMRSLTRRSVVVNALGTSPRSMWRALIDPQQHPL